MTSWNVLEGDCRDVLRTLPAGSVHTVITSPPYFGLRDYGTGEWDGGNPDCDHVDVASSESKNRLAPAQSGGMGNKTPGVVQTSSSRATMQYRDACGRCGATRVDRQIGLEPTPDEFVHALVAVFREVRRVLRDDGTVWLNLGDSYAANRTYQVPSTKGGAKHAPAQGFDGSAMSVPEGMKPKDLIGVPWMVAFALRADGWYLRSEVIWHKPNPMPESVTDRPTKAHEQVFLLSKQPRYFYDADAIREDQAPGTEARTAAGFRDRYADGAVDAAGYRGPVGGKDGIAFNPAGRNKRSVWTVATQPYAGAHFATFPPKLIEPCVLAGCPEGGTVLDPFNGAGTTGLVALRHNRSYVGIELNPEYAELARTRIRDDAPLMNTASEAA